VNVVSFRELLQISTRLLAEVGTEPFVDSDTLLGIVRNGDLLSYESLFAPMRIPKLDYEYHALKFGDDWKTPNSNRRFLSRTAHCTTRRTSTCPITLSEPRPVLGDPTI
jgi:hypothetical protein